MNKRDGVKRGGWPMDCEREIEREGGRKEKGKLVESAGTLQHTATLLNAEEH